MSRPSIAQLPFRNATVLLLSTLCVLVTAVLPASGYSASNSKQRRLPGRWRLNQELSAHSTGSLPGDVTGSDPFGNGNGAVAVNDSQSDLASVRVRELLDATTSLEIFLHGRRLTMNATGSAFVVLTRTIYTDGRPSEQRFGLGDNGEGQAQWSDKKFTVETRTKRGPKLTETYELSPNGERLYVMVKIETESWPRPLLIRRVYDREPASTHIRVKKMDF
jgi:hypothetical protein